MWTSSLHHIVKFCQELLLRQSLLDTIPTKDSLGEIANHGIVRWSYFECFNWNLFFPSRTGWQGPVGCFVFFLIGTFINKILMGPVVSLVAEQEKCEGDFRYFF